MLTDKINNLSEYLTFDDVLILPESSGIEPGEVLLNTRLTKKINLEIPICSAIMDTVTETNMAIALARFGGIGFLHRNNTIKEQLEMVAQVKKHKLLVGAGCGPFDLERAKALDQAGVDVIAVDCSHGHNKKVIDSALKIKKSVKAQLVVGNIATADAAKELVKFADAIKVGVGPGSICTTRIVSGVGVPQLSAISEVVKIATKYSVPVIADGGMKTSGDGAKALAVGASSLMFGSMLAGFNQSPGKIILLKGEKYKNYRGMGSKAVLNSNSSSDRYLQQKSKNKVAEGIEALVPFKGNVEDQINDLVGGLKIAFGFVGAKNIDEFHQKTRLIKITQASLLESHPHSVIKNNPR